MKKKFDGFHAAIELLQGLDLSEQQSVLADIARQDPEMAVKLKSSLVTFDDLRYLTQSMMSRLMKEIKLEVFGLALRGAQPEVAKHIMSLVSSRNREEIEDVLKGKPRSLSEVMDSQKKIMGVVLKLVDTGEIVLSKDKSEKYV